MATLTEFLLNIFSLHWSSNLTVPIKVAVRLIFSALIDQFAITECLLSVNERNLFPCCHQSHYRPTLRHSWPPAPASVSPSTGHFVSHPGVTPGPITQPGHHPHPGLRHQAMQYAADPCHPRPSRVCPRCLHTINIIINMAPCQEHQDSVTNINVRGTQGQGVTLNRDKDNGCLVPGMWAVSWHLWQSEPLRGGGGDTGWEQECGGDWQLNKYSAQQ